MQYKTIEYPITGEFKDRGSKFIAYAYPVYQEDAIKIYIKQLKKEHNKAVHHCYAWRLGTDLMRFRTADDGEPSSSAGRPILGRIDSFGLTNVLVVVVRYFGGTLLGVPGLIHAYKTATEDAFLQAKIIEKEVQHYLHINFEYEYVNPIMSIIKNYPCKISVQILGIVSNIHLSLPSTSYTGFSNQLLAVGDIKIKIQEVF